MKRFNQYLNGQREPQNQDYIQPVIKSEDDVRITENLKEYEKFLDTLKEESIRLKELIFNSLIGKGLFIDDTMTDEQRNEIKEEMK